LAIRGLILFDIDGVIRDVTNSYRLSVKKTVKKFCDWEPSTFDIDELKNEGVWNNDWDLSLELIKRYMNKNQLSKKLPNKKEIITIFEKLYFGCNPEKKNIKWSGFINNERILIDRDIFDILTTNKIAWGFVSGAEKASAKFILENRLNLRNPPLVAMGDAPDKPNPEGFLTLAKKLIQDDFGENCPPIAYIGDTIADVQTVINSRKLFPSQNFISIAVSPPHLQIKSNITKRRTYEINLKSAGADFILQSINDIKKVYKEIFNT
tara:strand:+ start:7239 stop:8033 length:795 start_codon:yes stop_codon:yes gene_type:complete